MIMNDDINIHVIDDGYMHQGGVRVVTSKRVSARVDFIYPVLKGDEDDTAAYIHVLRTMLIKMVEDHPNINHVELDDAFADIIRMLSADYFNKAEPKAEYFKSQKALDQHQLARELKEKYSFLSTDLTIAELVELDKYMVLEHEAYEFEKEEIPKAISLGGRTIANHHNGMINMANMKPSERRMHDSAIVTSSLIASISGLNNV